MPYPYREMSGFGSDATDAATATAANKTSGLMLIGLGALVIVGGIIAFGPKKMHANASRRKKRTRKATKRTKRTSSHANKTYAYWAKIMRRDLDAGYLTPGEVDGALRAQFDKDRSEYRRDKITSAKQFVKGVRAKL